MLVLEQVELQMLPATTTTTTAATVTVPGTGGDCRLDQLTLSDISFPATLGTHQHRYPLNPLTSRNLDDARFDV